MPKARPPKKATPRKRVSKEVGPAVLSLTEPQLKKIQARVQADPRLLKILGFFNTFVQASEYQVIQMMVHSGDWRGAVPLNPGGKGAVEFGLLGYWLNNPGASHVLLALQVFWKLLVKSLPVTHINAANYRALRTAAGPGERGLVGNDGTLYNQDPYAQLDPAWAEAVVGYLLNLVDLFKPFPQSPATVTLTGASSSQVTIALVGDWGTDNYRTGDYPKASVMQAIVAQHPDYIIHLGDVYYAGAAGEEQNNLLAPWPSTYSGKSFTLNSNHEMYDGANGYFKTVLASKIFSLQNKTSYFALQYGNFKQKGGPWTIVGLDSAYWSTWPMVMHGSIQESSSKEKGATAQPEFIKGLLNSGLLPQNAIVLTHHNPIEYDGSDLVRDLREKHLRENNLWTQVTVALGGTPAAWYWGHVHNGIVYPNPTAKGHFKGYGRCVGHGAIPYGNAWGLANAPSNQVQYYANTPNPRAPWRVMNGFALLTITTKGQVTETFYQQDGKPAPWVKPFTYQLG